MEKIKLEMEEGEIGGNGKDKMEKSENIIYSKITKGKRIVIPKEIAEIYKIKNGDMAEWIYDKEGNIRIKIKEVVIKDKRPKG